VSSRTLAFFAISVTVIIYGVTFTIAKEVMGGYVAPFGFILLRVFGASMVFWVVGLFLKNTKPIERNDYKKIALAAFFGVGLNMLTFFKGLNFTTPISASVIMVTSPISVLLFSSLLLKERITKLKVIGIFIGLIGATVLITSGGISTEGSNAVLGNVLVFINAASYALYLVLVKNLVTKYNPLVFVKWLYFFGVIYVLPFGLKDVIAVDWATMPTTIYAKVGFVVFFTTCVTYLFNLFALSKLRPTTVSVFIYLQPVVATIYALVVGSDSLNLIKIIATLFIFLGVFLVTKRAE